MALKTLLRLNGLTACVFGLGLFVWPSAGVLTQAYGIDGLFAANGYAYAAFVRFFIVLCVGYGLVLWGASAAAETSAGPTIAKSVFVAHLFGVGLLSLQQVAIWNSTVGLLTVGVFLAFTLAYAGVLLNLRRRRQKPSGIQTT